jgi:HD-GYP domain-containing protein (c-di-GMP phosphodiesterase class II)
MTIAAEQHAVPRTNASLSAIGVAALKVAKARDIDLFTIGEDGKPLLYRGRDYHVTSEDFERLEAKGIRQLYVAMGAYDRLTRQLRADLTEILSSDELPATDRFQILQLAVESEITNAFNRVDPNEAVCKSREMGRHVVTLLQGSTAVPQQLFRVMQHDFNTFSHVVNVSSYCVLLAQRLGIANATELQEIAVGGMLHDIGKRRVPATIVKKPGRLTDHEFDVIKQHPTIGYTELQGRDDVTFPQLMMVYQHHERMDGTGYPVGCPSSELHLCARLCAVVDVFDAVTGERPYRRRMSVDNALGLLNRMAGDHLDSEIVQCWTKTMRER